ncbi:hypothetical protein QBC35DRAFT_489921 [Podospora australis]|uniref:Uncharacterized protein n=1 Tax=Podospora australis TaxID=1536484 RepID=A0AAN7AKI2_9PEZI|nr:hypothetical protein QBC35DRAFT_489921 [Podospora australis]
MVGGRYPFVLLWRFWLYTRTRQTEKQTCFPKFVKMDSSSMALRVKSHEQDKTSRTATIVRVVGMGRGTSTRGTENGRHRQTV